MSVRTRRRQWDPMKRRSGSRARSREWNSAEEGCMNRREFVKLAGSGVSTAALVEAVVSAQQAQAPAKSGIVAPTTSAPVKMKVGTQHGHSEDILRACAAFGVNNICSGLPSARMDD